MSKPTLLIIAGCNGSGKSSYSRWLGNDEFVPFDYDAHFARFYKSLIPSEMQHTMADNLAWQEFERQIMDAINTNGNFCYETNFNSTPLY